MKLETVKTEQSIARTKTPLYIQAMMDLNRYLEYHVDEIEIILLKVKIRTWMQLTPPGLLKKKLRGALNFMTRRPIIRTIMTISSMIKTTCEIQEIETLEKIKIIQASRFVKPKDILRSAILWNGETNYEKSRNISISL